MRSSLNFSTTFIFSTYNTQLHVCLGDKLMRLYHWVPPNLGLQSSCLIFASVETVDWAFFSAFLWKWRSEEMKAIVHDLTANFLTLCFNDATVSERLVRTSRLGLKYFVKSWPIKLVFKSRGLYAFFLFAKYYWFMPFRNSREEKSFCLISVHLWKICLVLLMKEP